MEMKRINIKQNNQTKKHYENVNRNGSLEQFNEMC